MLEVDQAHVCRRLRLRGKASLQSHGRPPGSSRCSRITVVRRAHAHARGSRSSVRLVAVLWHYVRLLQILVRLWHHSPGREILRLLGNHDRAPSVIGTSSAHGLRRGLVLAGPLVVYLRRGAGRSRRLLRRDRLRNGRAFARLRWAFPWRRRAGERSRRRLLGSRGLRAWLLFLDEAGGSLACERREVAGKLAGVLDDSV